MDKSVLIHFYNQYITYSMKFKLLAVFTFTALLYSCDDSTTGVGDFVSNLDKIEALIRIRLLQEHINWIKYIHVQTKLIWGNTQIRTSGSIQPIL